MIVNLSHKIRLDPTCKQETYFFKACGISRFAWNWALSKWDEKFKKGEKVNAFLLKKEFNALKTTEFPWVYEVTKYASQQPFIHLQRSFQAFFSKRTKYPKYKKKGIHDSFYIGGDQLKINGSKVKIPNLGWVRLKESLRFEGKINGATVSRSAGYWFISINVETEQQPIPCESQADIGVDLGIKTLATLSDGTQIPSNQTLTNNLARLRRFQRQLARKKLNSKNRTKVKRRIAKLHYRITCSRNDTLHKLTTHLTQNFRHIVIEDLDISKMLKNNRLSRAIMNGGWHEFKRQLTYKAELRRNKVFVADKWFASSKTCSSCGNCKSELSLSERVYDCSHCKLKIDRDLNAAICLKNLINTVSSTEIQACGQNGSVILLKTVLQPVWKNQELSTV